MKEPFEAVVVRYAHDARVGEALNLGVVIVPRVGAPACEFLQSFSRITGAFPGADSVAIRRVTKAIERVVIEAATAQQELALVREASAAGLVRRALHISDEGIVLSHPVSGLTSDASRTARELFALYVGSDDNVGDARPTRDDADVWRQFAQTLDQEAVRAVQHKQTIRAKRLELVFEQSWRNGRLNVLQPLSFDMADANRISVKAQRWVGGLFAAKEALEDTGVYFLVGLPDEGASQELRQAAADAFEMLSESLAGALPEGVHVVSERDREKLARKIAEDLKH